MTCATMPQLTTDTPSPGAYRDVSFEEYARWQLTNWHTLKPFGLSALQGRYEMTLPRDATDSMVFGGAFHCRLLEPDRFRAVYRTMPRFDGHPNSNAHKAQKAAWIEANAAKVSLTNAEVETIEAMARAVMAHPVAWALLSGPGRNELSIAWKDQLTGEPCKGRVDRLCRVAANVIDRRAKGHAICMVDLKTTSNFHRFDAEVAKYGYHAQAAFYADGLQQLEPAEIVPLIVAAQDSPPFDVAVYHMAEACEDGRRLYRRLLRQLIRCRQEDRWPGVCPDGTLPVLLPPWAREPENDE